MTERKPVDLDRFIDEVEVGKHDGRLVDIIQACNDRAVEADQELRWRITIGEDVWDEDTISIGEMSEVERLTGKNWLELGRGPLQSAQIIQSFVIAHLHAAKGVQIDDAFKQASAYPARTLMQAVSLYRPKEPAGKGPAAPTS